MAYRRKDTPKRPRRPLKPSEIAAMLIACGSLLSGAAALLEALNK